MAVVFQKLGNYLGISLLFWGAVFCQTKNENVLKKEILYYSLQEEKETTYALFPKIYSHEISVLAHYAGGSTRAYKGFRLWDIDQNGRADAIESLGGELLPVRFDFNSDGVLEKLSE